MTTDFLIWGNLLSLRLLLHITQYVRKPLSLDFLLSLSLDLESKVSSFCAALIKVIS